MIPQNFLHFGFFFAETLLCGRHVTRNPTLSQICDVEHSDSGWVRARGGEMWWSRGWCEAAASRGGD
jgi:hypothetical protein